MSGGERRRRGRSALRHLPTLLRLTVAQSWKDRILGLSAEAAFWQMLSLPSLFLALVATLGYVSRWFGNSTVDRTESQIESTTSQAFNAEVTKDVIHPMLNQILHSGRADLISIGFVLALWAGSSATATFVNTITIAYGMRDMRGAVRSRLLALWLFLGSVLVGVIALPMMVLGPRLLQRLFPARWRPDVSSVINNGYYPVLVLLLVLGLTTLYHLAPPRRLPWGRGVPGAILAMSVFLVGSLGLRTYIRFVLSHNHAYASLAAPIAALLYFFVLALGVLLGAEFNAAVESASPTPLRQPRVLRPRGWRHLDEPLPADEPMGSDDERGTEDAKPTTPTPRSDAQDDSDS